MIDDLISWDASSQLFMKGGDLLDINMRKYLDSFRADGMNDQQLKEIRTGIEHKISTTRIRLYAKLEYDSHQMEQIRLGIEHGLTDEQIATFADPAFSDDEMEHIRTRLEFERRSKEEITEELHRKRLHNILIAVAALGLLLVIGLVGFFGFDTIRDYLQPLNIVLTSNDVTLDPGDVFSPMNYVKSYTQQDTELILPDPIDTDTVGDQKVLYTLKNGHKSVSRELMVHVVDDDAPVITLSSDSAELTRKTDSFSCRAFLLSATDSYDGDLTDQVKCNSLIDWSKDEVTVPYTVEDSSGNAAEADLVLTIKEKPKPTPTLTPAPTPTPQPKYTPSPDFGSGQSSDSSSGGEWQTSGWETYSETSDWVYEDVGGGETYVDSEVIEDY